MNDQCKPLGLDDITCIASAEGMARRVLEDIEKAHLTPDELEKAYQADLDLLGSRYDHLISLGNLLGRLDKAAGK
jgi:hypothetical protein